MGVSENSAIAGLSATIIARERCRLGHFARFDGFRVLERRESRLEQDRGSYNAWNGLLTIPPGRNR